MITSLCILSFRPFQLLTADRSVHGAYSVVIHVLQLVIGLAFSRCVRKFIPCSRGCIAPGRDERVVDLCVKPTLASGTVDVETGIINLCSRLPRQDNTAVGDCTGFEVEQRDGGRRFCWSWSRSR